MKIVGLDTGGKTIGVAISDAHRLLARPLATIRFQAGEEANAVEQLRLLLTPHTIETIVIGHPKNMDGTVGSQAKHAEIFHALIQEKMNIHTVLWDERLSTRLADATIKLSGMRWQKRRRDIDQEAASHILQSYLDHIQMKEETR